MSFKGTFSANKKIRRQSAKVISKKDKKTTFLHYVIVVVKRNHEQLLSFKDDLPTVFKSDKIYWDQCLLDLEEAEDQLENLRMVALKKASELSQSHMSSSYKGIIFKIMLQI